MNLYDIYREGSYIPDFKSRYFLEDFPYGLCILRGFAKLADKPADHMDQILKWYCSVSGKIWYEGNRFEGKDLTGAVVPQKYGITSLKELGDFYR